MPSLHETVAATEAHTVLEVMDRNLYMLFSHPWLSSSRLSEAHPEEGSSNVCGMDDERIGRIQGTIQQQ